LRRALALAVVVATLGWAGRAPADIQEQRARLPPAAQGCADELSGTWRAHAYEVNQWRVVTVHIRRVPGDPTRLEGSFTTELWIAPRDRPERPVCVPGVQHRTLAGALHGTLVGEHMEWWNDAGIFDEILHCGVSEGRYFGEGRSVGTLHRAEEEFHASWTGSTDPVVYRRIDCGGASAPNPVPVPRPAPPLHPPSPRARGGCGC